MSYTPKNALVWCEIPVVDLKKAMAFYSVAFDYEMTLNSEGVNPVAYFPISGPGASAGHLYEGKPASNGSGPSVYLSIEGKLEDAADRVVEAGGKVNDTAIQIPQGRFLYINDPDGNSVAMFEAAI